MVSYHLPILFMLFSIAVCGNWGWGKCPEIQFPPIIDLSVFNDKIFYEIARSKKSVVKARCVRFKFYYDNTLPLETGVSYGYENRKYAPKFLPKGQIACDAVTTHLCSVRAKFVLVKSPYIFIGTNSDYTIGMVCKSFMYIFHYKAAWMFTPENTMTVALYAAALLELEGVGIYEKDITLTD